MSGIVHLASPGVLFQLAVASVLMVKGRVHLVRVSKKWLKKHLAKALSILLDGDGPELIHECARG